MALYALCCWLLAVVCFELFVDWWTGELGSQVVMVQRMFHAAGMAVGCRLAVDCWLLAVLGFWTCACSLVGLWACGCRLTVGCWLLCVYMCVGVLRDYLLPMSVSAALVLLKYL